MLIRLSTIVMSLKYITIRFKCIFCYLYHRHIIHMCNEKLIVMRLEKPWGKSQNFDTNNN